MAGDQNTAWAGASRTPDIRAAIRRQLPLILALTLIGALAGFGYSATRDATYESKATVQLIATSSEQAPGGGLGRTLDVETQATVARATTLLNTVADRLGLTITQVRRSSHAEAAASGDILYLKFEAGTAEKAAEGATVYTEEYMAQRQAVVDQEVDQQRKLLEAQRDDLTAQIADLTTQIAAASPDDPEYNVLSQSQLLAIRDLASVRDSLATIENPPAPARVVVDPRTAVNKTGLQVPYTTLGGGLVGLLVGIIMGLLRDRSDDRYGSAVDLDSIGIHETGRLRYVANPRSPQAGRADPGVLQAYSRLLTRLSFSNGLPSNTERSVLLVAVESETVPVDAAERVAEVLAMESSKLGIVLDVFSAASTALEAGSSYWETVPAALGELTKANDLVLVPGVPLDRSATSLGLSSVVRETILLVSLRTHVHAVQQAISDLRSVDADDVRVVVLTHVPRRAGR